MDATYISGNTFNVSFDRTNEFVPNRRVRAYCGVDGYKYGTVSGSSYNTVTTVVLYESVLTSNLTEVHYGIVSSGPTGSLPNHEHDGTGGEGGTISGTGADPTPVVQTLIGLTDTPAGYDAGKYLRSTVSGTEWATVSGGTSADALLKDGSEPLTGDWNYGSYTISGTGDIYCNDIYTSSGTVYIGDLKLSTDGTNLLVDGSQISTVQTLLDLTDTPITYDEGKFLYSKGDGTKWVDVPAGTLWLTGQGTPTNSLGDPNNFYLDTISGSVFSKTVLVYGADQCTGGTASASEYVLSYVPSNAFDNNTSYASSRWSTGNSPSYPVWLQYQFATQKQIQKLRMHPANDIKSPRDFTFRASNTGAFSGEEVILLNVVDEPQWPENVWKEYEFSNDESYLYYRIYITEINSGGSEVHLSEVEMLELDSAEWELVYTPETYPTTFSGLSDTPADYGSSGQYLKSTGVGMEWSTISGSSTTISKGKQSLKVEYATASGIYINPGEIEINDIGYEVSSQLNVTVSGLTNYYWYGVYVDPPTSGNVITADNIKYSASIGDKDVPRMGYYHTTNTDWRLIGFFKADGSGNIQQWAQEGNEYIFTDWDDINYGAAWESGDGTTITTSIGVPKGGFIGNIIVDVSVGGPSSDSPWIRVRKGGASGAGKRVYRLNQNGGSNREYVNLLVETNSSKEIDVIADMTPVSDWWLNIILHGFILPDYIYTGA